MKQIRRQGIDVHAQHVACDGHRDAEDIISRVKKMFEDASSVDLEACIQNLLNEGLVQRLK